MVLKVTDLVEVDEEAVVMEVTVVMEVVVLKVMVVVVVVEVDIRMEVVEDLLIEDLVCFDTYNWLDGSHPSFRIIS